VSRRDTVLLTLVLLASLGARFMWLTDEFNVNEPDEFLHLTIAENFAIGFSYPRYDPGGYEDGFWPVPSLPMYVVGRLFRWPPPDLWTFRYITALVGVGCVVAFHLLSRLYLRGIGHWVAVVLFALSPLSLYGSTHAMLGFYGVLFLLLTLWAYVRYIQDEKTLHLVLYAVFLAATCASKHYGLLIGGVTGLHWLWVRRAPGRLLMALSISTLAFVILQPWCLWRPVDFAHGYFYRMFFSHIVTLLRGERGGGSLFAVPYKGIVFAHGAIGLIGLGVFCFTWRRKWDVLAFYGLLLALPITVFREARYLSLALPAACLFTGYLVMAVRQATTARVPAIALVTLLAASVVPTAVIPWRVPSGLVGACRYANATGRGTPVLSNYWRPVVLRLMEFGYPFPECEWVDGTARPYIERGHVGLVILDDSPYTRIAISTPERLATADWVRKTFPRVYVSPPGVYRTEVYDTSQGCR
jgi:hypothetical protein